MQRLFARNGLPSWSRIRNGKIIICGFVNFIARRNGKRNMIEQLKILANTIAVGTSNNSIGGAKLVSLLNTDTVNGLITLFDTVANVQVATVQLAPNERFNLKKRTTDVITANNATKMLATTISSV